jgi:hypothetical protein
MPAAATYAVPSSIDATGTADASTALNSWLATVPNGSTITFKAGGVYRMDQSLAVNSRRNLVLEGNGATLRSSGGWTEQDSLITTYLGDHITIRNFTLVGASPTPGVHIVDKQWAYGILVGNSTAVEIANVNIRDTYGDCVTLDGWADGVWFHDSTCTAPSRAGFAILAARNVTVERVAFDRAMPLNIEPYRSSGGADHVRFVNNTATKYGVSDPATGLPYFFAANGALGSTVNDVTVSGNHVTAAPLFVDVIIARRTNIVITNNRSDVTATSGPYGAPIMRFAHVDGLTVTGNIQPIAAGKPMFSSTDCTGVTYR